ncbi:MULTISPECIES: hypothetical protein [Enterobacteriaceae]|uniref:hypothetical protein n=1 Tax=Enterobacteriaceae TaxID=543 RepID=UPI00038F5263|nr:MULTISPECIES: hypothetical protein [Enterobacteriaceae]EQP77991.1 hypothetical protein G744_05059 [Escherichia coli HVH 82 (4-2209276)]MCV5268751.1 hypothetical protein [Escherichia coli]MDZ7008673.1 hypothetical protein [Escherichia coli]VAY01997.1 Uncharacterised protein [Escherichia coli]
MLDYISNIYKLIILQPTYFILYFAIIVINLAFAYSITITIKSSLWRLSVFTVLFCVLVSVSIIWINPKDDYNQIKKNQELVKLVTKKCKIKALNAQQGGLFGVDKDEWVCPDNKSFYLPEKYRPENWKENWIRNTRMKEE